MVISEQTKLKEKQRGYKVTDEALYNDWKRDSNIMVITLLVGFVVMAIALNVQNDKVDQMEDSLKLAIHTGDGCKVIYPSENMKCVSTITSPIIAACTNKETSEVKLWNK